MMNAVNGAIALFQGQQAQCPRCSAIAIAVAAFVLGFVVAMLMAMAKCRAKCAAKGTRNAGGANRNQRRREEPKFEKVHPAPADGSIEIYVGNLSYDLTEDQLRKEFEAYGKVNSARIITNRFNGRSKGFGFVHMPNKAEVNAAIAALSEKEILGRALKCNVAKNVA